MSAWGVSFGKAWGSAWGGNISPVLASLGGAPYREQKQRKRIVPDEVEDALPESAISRIRYEFLSEALADDLITRARVRKSRAEEEALLLMI